MSSHLSCNSKNENKEKASCSTTQKIIRGVLTHFRLCASRKESQPDRGWVEIDLIYENAQALDPIWLFHSLPLLFHKFILWMALQLSTPSSVRIVFFFFFNGALP